MKVPPSFDSACTCKICNHGLARDCIKVNCNCCNKEDSSSHSLVLDGIEGFAPTSKTGDRETTRLPTWAKVSSEPYCNNKTATSSMVSIRLQAI